MSAFFVTLFFLLVVITVAALITLRRIKIKREKRKKSYQDTIDVFLNNCLFDESFDLVKEAKNFKRRHLTCELEKKIAVREILIYKENLKGESSSTLKTIFHALELDLYVLASIKDGEWYDKARGIYVLSELQVIHSDIVAPFVGDKNEIVRAQAIYYFIKTATSQPLAFFQNLKKELTLWELIQIEDSIKYDYKGPAPDFSIWLNHELCTVLIFSIRMIQQFNQFEYIPAIIPFLYHPDEKVRKEAVSSLRKLQYEELLEKVVPRFSKETQAVKKEIIKAVESLGDLDMLYGLKPTLAHNTEWQTQLMYRSAEKRMKPNL